MVMGYAHCMVLEVNYLLGRPLSEVVSILEEKKDAAKGLKHDNLDINIGIYSYLLAALRGQITVVEAIEKMHRDEHRELVTKDKCALATLYILETQLLYLVGRYKEALAVARKVESLEDAIMGFLNSAEYNLYYSLAIAEALQDCPASLKGALSEAIAEELSPDEKMGKVLPGEFSAQVPAAGCRDRPLEKAQG